MESFPVNRRVSVGGELSVSVPVDTLEAALFGSGEPLRFTLVSDRGAGTVAVPPPRTELYIHVTLPSWVTVDEVASDNKWYTETNYGRNDAEPRLRVDCVAGATLEWPAVEGPEDEFTAQFVELVPATLRGLAL